MSEPSKLSYEERELYACKVCANVPDEYGIIEHGKGCYILSSDGGGYSYVDLPEGMDNQRPPITDEQWMNHEEPIENGEYLCKFDSPLKSIGWVFKICTYSAKAFYCDGVFVEPNYYTKLNKFWLTTLTDILEGPKQGGKQ